MIAYENEGPEISRASVFATSLETERMNAAAIAHGEMARRLAACVEVLVKPVPARAVDTSLTPLDLDDFIFMALAVGVNAHCLCQSKTYSIDCVPTIIAPRP